MRAQAVEALLLSELGPQPSEQRCIEKDSVFISCRYVDTCEPGLHGSTFCCTIQSSCNARGWGCIARGVLMHSARGPHRCSLCGQRESVQRRRRGDGSGSSRFLTILGTFQLCCLLLGGSQLWATAASACYQAFPHSSVARSAAAARRA